MRSLPDADQSMHGGNLGEAFYSIIFLTLFTLFTLFRSGISSNIAKLANITRSNMHHRRVKLTIQGMNTVRQTMAPCHTANATRKM